MSRPLSDDDRSSAIRRILLRSSAGNIDSVLSDLKILSPINASVAESFLTECEKESGRIVLHDEHRNLSSKTDNSMVKNIELRLNDYMKTNYSSKAVEAGAQVLCVSTAKIPNSTESYDIIVYAEKVDLKNCYSGSWKGRFHIECSKEISFSGTVQVIAHVFESDNVQLTCELQYPPKRVDLSHAEEDISLVVVRQLEFIDSQVIKSMENMYQQVYGGLRSLRKAIPVTRTKFDWNLNSQRFRRTLSHGLNIK